MYMFLIVLIIFIIFICVSLLYFLKKFKNANLEHYHDNSETEPIYCVMVTGKDTTRWNFAKIAIRNFEKQTYNNKKLIIINEGREIKPNNRNILELVITNRKEKNMTLGDLRNLAFEFIPENAIWTLWDDDDWRSNNYLSYLYSHLENNEYIFFTKRIEHNLNTKFTWLMELKSGFVIMFGRKKWNLIYDSKDFNEDIPLKHKIKTEMKYKVIENDPKIYIRMVHKTNTSVIANKNKMSLKYTNDNRSYFEYKASTHILDYVKSIIHENYNILE